ncbi:hypothetical protein PMAYCL1PPCAC_15389 [Pristionchus mayeri]|uniref:Uncharacterized protein n=1 Tax=Pristionchus mayeri TaxID=1317129 RepID=A0AAN5HYJ4_9BILA|nr:hypothetical protein PMAYCL1PPCAC_15389 [Pristionchus mayeri]
MAEEEEEKKKKKYRRIFNRSRLSDFVGGSGAVFPQGLGPMPTPGDQQDIKPDGSGGFISSSGQRYMINPVYGGAGYTYGGYGGYPAYGGYPGFGGFGYGGYPGFGGYGGYPGYGYPGRHTFPYGMNPCAWNGGFYPFAGLPPLFGYPPNSVDAIHSAVHKMGPNSPNLLCSREKRQMGLYGGFPSYGSPYSSLYSPMSMGTLGYGGATNPSFMAMGFRARNRH